jgi:hypothetical protein
MFNSLGFRLCQSNSVGVIPWDILQCSSGKSAVSHCSIILRDISIDGCMKSGILAAILDRRELFRLDAAVAVGKRMQLIESLIKESSILSAEDRARRCYKSESKQ